MDEPLKCSLLIKGCVSIFTGDSSYKAKCSSSITPPPNSADKDFCSCSNMCPSEWTSTTWWRVRCAQRKPWRIPRCLQLCAQECASAWLGKQRHVLEGKRVGAGQLDVSIPLIGDDRGNTLRQASHIQIYTHRLTHTRSGKYFASFTAMPNWNW